jgi:hypothetical protein
VKKFEYMKTYLAPASDRHDDISMLNGLGAAGWRLILIRPNAMAYLVREVEEAEPAPRQKRAYTRRTPPTDATP